MLVGSTGIWFLVAVARLLREVRFMIDKKKETKARITPIGDGDETRPGGDGGHEARDKSQGNGHVTAEDVAKLAKTVEAQGAALMRVIQHLQAQGGQQQQQQQSMMNQKERRDLFQVLTDPPDEILPALTDINPMMATMIPAMNVIRWNYTPRSERPINPVTRRPYGMYLLWELDLARWSLSKNAHNAIRMADVVQFTGQQTGRMGVVAE